MKKMSFIFILSATFALISQAHGDQVAWYKPSSDSNPQMDTYECIKINGEAPEKINDCMRKRNYAKININDFKEAIAPILKICSDKAFKEIFNKTNCNNDKITTTMLENRSKASPSEIAQLKKLATEVKNGRNSISEYYNKLGTTNSILPFATIAQYLDKTIYPESDENLSELIQNKITWAQYNKNKIEIGKEMKNKIDIVFSTEGN